MGPCPWCPWLCIIPTLDSRVLGIFFEWTWYNKSYWMCFLKFLNIELPYDLKLPYECFSGVPVLKSPLANSGDTRGTDSIPGSGKSPGVGNGNQFQYSCLKNSMNRGAWQAIVHGVTKSQTQLSMWALWKLRPQGSRSWGACKIFLLSSHDYQGDDFNLNRHSKEWSWESDKIPIQILILLLITYVI